MPLSTGRSLALHALIIIARINFPDTNDLPYFAVKKKKFYSIVNRIFGMLFSGKLFLIVI